MALAGAEQHPRWATMRSPALALHAGAGTHSHPRDQIFAALAEAMRAGLAAFGSGATAAGAEALVVLENCGLFDAGRGSVRDSAGDVTMDALVMRGSDQRAGAVAGLRRCRNPIRAAHLVLDRTKHVMLVGGDADEFALNAGADAVEDGWFILNTSGHPGTVGAVARDANGVYAAATSTGGLSGKLPGRVGDSAAIGCGTWADPHCAISATGVGECFMRICFAHRIALRRELSSLHTAAEEAIDQVVTIGGEGGAIVLGDDGYHFPLRAAQMPRAWLDDRGVAWAAIEPCENAIRLA
jgi:L-asparaginase / beta-aspartyl-peptidase